MFCEIQRHSRALLGGWEGGGGVKASFLDSENYIHLHVHFETP